MKQTLALFALAVTAITFSNCEAFGQTPPPPSAETAGASAAGALQQMAAAFSAGKPVHQVQLTGQATWRAGSLEDSGPVTLSATSSGSAEMHLALSATGTRTETQSGQGSAQSCAWAGSDGVVHEGNLINCWKPAVWFLPAISFQPTIMHGNTGVSDLGMGTVGAGTYRHLQSQMVFSDTPLATTTAAMKASTSEIGVDPATSLPAVLVYKVQPDSGSQTPISIEIRYSNYKAVSGVQIPFCIRRYVNGSLQLDITISSAQVN